MLDDEARRALEEEAIALVNLSNSHPSKKRPASAGAEAVAGGKRQRQPMARSPTRGIHPLLQKNKEALMARRDDSIAVHPHRLNSTSAAVYRPPGVLLKPLERSQDERCLSMSVFVSSEGQMSVLPNEKASPDHQPSLSLASIDPVVIVKEEQRGQQGKSLSPTSTTTGDSHSISMQSLLVDLKKRTGDDGNESSPASATKLPRFRDVFEQARLDIHPASMATIAAASGPYMTQAPAPPMPASPPPSLEAVEESPHPPPPGLKCKYRTGKCGNIRALKSCGDYHNLCNYHRLRANANQRKLDRKKKVQRGHPASEATSPVAASVAMAAPTASAAAALASMPTAFMMQRSMASNQHQPHAGARFAPYLVSPSVTMPLPQSSSAASASLLRSKPEANSC